MPIPVVRRKKLNSGAAIASIAGLPIRDWTPGGTPPKTELFGFSTLFLKGLLHDHEGKFYQHGFI
jgi:hypothetical protein